MTHLAVLPLLLAALSSADAVLVLLNTRNATSARTFAEAEAVVARDAAAGKPLQQFVAGVTSPDRAKAARYLNAARPHIREMAEKSGNAMAWYLLSLEKNDFSCLRKAADGGNVQALNALGSIAVSQALARDGMATNSLESILRDAFGCFRRAAAQQDQNGFINLGACYLRGLGCDQDLQLAFLCFKAAAEAGHPEGMDNLSGCYQFGHGVQKNMTLSRYWALKARALRGDAEAEKKLKELR